MALKTRWHASPPSFYRHVIEILQEEKIPFLVGGAFALDHYTSVGRRTKDLDLFIEPKQGRKALTILSQAGYRIELTAAHWLGKAFHKDYLVDFIFGFANGLDQVDQNWFRHATEGSLYGLDVSYVGPEDMIWSKSFVQERDRFDGADMMHMLQASADDLDWGWLLRRFGPHWRVLLCHLIMFGYVYPGERKRIPARVMNDLLKRLQPELMSNARTHLCQGTLFSREEYVMDTQVKHYADAKLRPLGRLSARQAME